MPPCIRLRSIVAHLGVAHRSFALLFLCLALALISATPAISQDDAPADETPLDQRLTLEITSPKGELSLGDEALVTLVATSAGTTAVEAVSLHLHSAPGIIWSDDFKGPQLELGDMAAGESRVIEGRVRVDGLPVSGSLGLFATLQGHGVEQAEARAELVVSGLPPEGVALAADGSLVESAGGRVRFTFPDSWNESDARLTFHLQEQFRQEAGNSGRLLLFTVEAAAADDNLVEAFDKPIEVTVNLSDLVDPEWSAANPPVVSTRRNDKENWTAVESTFDAKTGVLSFTTIHFSEYQVTTEPQLWMLLYNPPGASPYNGAATYQYPIDLPPGIGGLVPDLTLSYGSRAADGMRRPAMSQGFGVGWALPQAQINNGNAGNFYTDDGDGTGNNKNYDPAAFALTLNGVNYYLNPLNTIGRYGTFKAIGAPELYIEYVEDNDATNDTDNVSGEFWRVRTPDGTTHTFGRSQGAEQVVWPMETQPFRNGGQHRNPKFAPYNWKLDSVVDVHGNRIEYVYETACGTKFDQPSVDRGEKIPVIGFQCSEVDTAVKKILYNFNGTTAQTKVMFTNAPVNGGPKKQEKTMTAGIFRPSSIEVRQGNAPNDALVRRYEFTYSSGAHYFSPWDVATEFWMLTSVTHKGSNGSTTLPVQTFTYNRDVIPGCADGVCVKLLTEVANGYGAVTVLSYENWPGTQWQHVTQTETWDGVTNRKGVQTQGKTRTVYSRPTGTTTACFDTQGSPCHMGTAAPSEALVGFNKVATQTQAFINSSWVPQARSETDFYNSNYLLLGKTDEHRQLNADGTAVLAKDKYVWTQVTSADGKFKDDQLTSETHTYNLNGTSLTSSIVYTYESLNPLGGSYSALKTKQEKDEAGANFRCTDYAYAHLTTGNNWLVNRPIRETVKAGGCGGPKVAETLYRYAGSTSPTVIGLDTRALLTYVLRWSGTNYVTEKHTYTAQGLPNQSITYHLMSSTSAYTSDTSQNTRSTVTRGYTNNPMGLPTTITTTGGAVATETQTLTYDTTFPWLVASVSDPNGIVTQYGYDVFGRLLKVAMPGDTLTNPTMWYKYYDNGSPIFLSPLLVGTFYKNTIKNDERAFYDGLGRLVQTQTAKGEVQGAGDKDIVTLYGYDARGLTVCATVPYAVEPYVYNPNNPVTPFQTTACTAKSRTTTAYDALGRVTSVTGPDGVVSEMAYSVSANHTVDGHSRFLRTTIYDGNDHVVNRFSDVFGREVLVREFTGNSVSTYAAYADTRYSYDVMDNLTAVKRSTPNDNQPGSYLWQTSMQYDALGRKTSMIDPDMGKWGYAYSTDGRLTRQEHLTGSTVNQATCLYYDNLGRLIRRINDSTPTGGCPASYSDTPSDGAHHLASYVYGTAGNIGRLMGVNWGSVPVNNNDAFLYDGEGRLQKQTRKVNNQTFVYEVTAYDLLDRPTQVKLPSGEVVVTTYDHEGANTLQAGSTTLISGVGYNERGQLALLQRSGGAPNTTWSYHPAAKNFRLSAITTGGSSNLPDFTYGTYDNVGNLKSVSMVNSWASDAYDFSYDEMNRLLDVDLVEITNQNQVVHDYKYEYDRLGNITKRMGLSPNMNYTYGTVSGTPVVTGGPQAVTRVDNSVGADWSYTYDARGNLDKRYEGTTLTHDYTFDTENRLTQVVAGGQTMSFAYDADGNRVMTTQPDGTIIYTPFPDYELTDPPRSSEADIVRTTYRIAGQIVAIQIKVGAAAGEFNFTYTDHLGSIAALSTTAGAYISNSLARYEPFGSFRTTPTGANPSRTSQGFTGHRHNNTGTAGTQNVGLIYMNARYYLPEVGRFVSADSVVPEPRNPQSFNRYSYVRNNPVNFTDPTGHRECGIVCEGDSVNEQELQFGSAYGGDWDPDQQAANAATAEAILTGVTETAVGMLWEPADWAFALSDGFQWHDTFGMLPLVPATVGRYGDDLIPLAQRIVGGTGKLYDKVNSQGLYVLLDDSGAVQYVGRGDVPVRFAAHSKDPVKSMFRQEVLAVNNLTYAEARGLEQLVIDNYHPPLNRINGIASSNPAKQGYLNAASSLFNDVRELIDGWLK